MLRFETRTGPDFGAAAPVYPPRRIPDWYRDAKLGFFIHWGLYSVPAWATAHGPGLLTRRLRRLRHGAPGVKATVPRSMSGSLPTLFGLPWWRVCLFIHHE